MSERAIFGLRPEIGRWSFVALGLLINLCLGAVYAFSVFRKPLEELWGIGATASGMPYMIFLAVFALAMAFAGGIVERWGPRKTGILGGILVGLGWILSGFAPNIGVLTLFYGIIAGAGVGIIYGCPVAVAAKWFPDKKGLAVGLTVMGFGLSALITAPIMNALISAAGPLRTFTVMGLAFLAVLVALSLPLRYPQQGWAPAGWKPSRAQLSTRVELDRREMVRTRTFYALWLTFAIGCLAGLMAIGISAPFGKEVVGLSSELAAIAVSVFAIFNGVGRPLFGWLTDRLTPKYAAVLSFGLIILASALLGLWGRGNVPLYFLGFSVLWLNLGGWLAIAPTATATFFGTRYYGKNYGLVYTAYGAGALLGGVLSGLIRDLTGSYTTVFFPVIALAAMGIAAAVQGLNPVRKEVAAPVGVAGGGRRS
ncbi:L-lactate MFS transporter [Candidatus Bipolaricaulota sp. J31]